MHLTRRHLQLGLGWLWLLDGCLSLQGSLLGASFVTTVLEPTLAHQPTIVAAPLRAAIGLVAPHAALAGLAIALVQLGLGLGLVVARDTRRWLALSIGWALVVWWIGEGLGGLLTGATLPSGAPGAALLYALIAVAAWPRRGRQEHVPPSPFAVAAWSVLWMVNGVAQVVADRSSTNPIASAAQMGQVGAPSWIAAVDQRLGTIHGDALGTMLIVLEVAVAIWGLVPGGPRMLSALVGSGLAVVAWVFFQGMGALTSGMATDPNTGPLILLLAGAVVAARPASGALTEAIGRRRERRVPVGAHVLLGVHRVERSSSISAQTK